MKLAKDCLDIGLLTDTRDTLDFLSGEVGLGEPEALRVTRKVTQYRFDVGGSVVKANLVEELASERRSGYAGILIAKNGLEEPVELCGPGGLAVTLVPAATRESASSGSGSRSRISPGQPGTFATFSVGTPRATPCGSGEPWCCSKRAQTPSPPSKCRSAVGPT